MRWNVLLGMVVCAGVCGCSRKPAEPKVRPDALARVGDVVITYTSVTNEMARRQKEGFKALDERELFDLLLTKEVCLARAETLNLANDPDVRAQLDRVLVNAVRAHEMKPLEDLVEITEPELMAMYTDNMEHFTIPGYERLSVIFVEKPRMSSEAKERELQGRTNQVQEAIEAWVSQPQFDVKKGFGRLATDYSDLDRGRYRGGDLGWVQVGQCSPFIPREVYDVGQGLPLGEVSGMLSMDIGYFWVMRTDSHETKVKPFEDVRGLLNTQLKQKKLKGKQSAYFKNIYASERVEFFTNQVSTLDTGDDPTMSRHNDKAQKLFFNGESI